MVSTASEVRSVGTKPAGHIGTEKKTRKNLAEALQTAALTYKYGPTQDVWLPPALVKNRPADAVI